MATNPSTEQDINQPVLVFRYGGTTVNVMDPSVVTDAERESQHRRIVKQVAVCLKPGGD